MLRRVCGVFSYPAYLAATVGSDLAYPVLASFLRRDGEEGVGFGVVEDV